MMGRNGKGGSGFCTGPFFGIYVRFPRDTLRNLRSLRALSN